MEQSSAQNPMSGLPHAAPQRSFPEYWNGLEPLYPDSQLQSQAQHPPQDPSSQQSILGGREIVWDSTMFQSQPQSQQAHLTSHTDQSHTDQSHAVYNTPIPHSWQSNPLQNPMHQSSRGFAVPPSYQTHQHVPQYQQGQLTLDSSSLAASESSAFPSYGYQTNLYHHQPLSAQDTFPERSTQQQPQSAIPPYSIPTSFPAGLLNTVDLTNDFTQTEQGLHQTIDPQFLNPGLQGAQQHHPQQQRNHQSQQPIQSNFLYGSPADFERPDGRAFNYFQNDLSIQPPQGAASNSAHSVNGSVSGSTGLPVPRVVIPVAKKTAAKKQPRAKKADTKGVKKSQTQSASDSSDDSELEIEAPPEPSPIPQIRPNEPIAAAEYDTLTAVWSPRNKWPAADKVKSALVAFKDVIKSLRDSWKDQVAAMKLAENQGDNDKASKIKDGVALQRRVMDKIMTTTLNMGHPMIVEKLGEHPMALSAIYSFLADRFQAADFEGSLTINILKLLERFLTVDEEMLQKTNLTKLLPRFVKKGGQTSKDLAQKVLDNGVASTKRKQTSAKSAKEDSPAKGPASDSPSGELVGSKRPREGENNTQPAKRVVVTSNLKEAGKLVGATNGTGKRAVDGTQNSKPPAATAPRPRPNIVAPKPTSLFGSLSSASKRPGTTNAERAAAAAAAAKPISNAEKKDKPTAAPAPPPPKPAFSFGDLMADLSKPKEPAVAKAAEENPPETEEERKKRLRKESRRKLRVSWKPDDILTEVRLFTHDPDEELGPQDGSLRGAGDVKGEGSVLKLHKDLEELEEEDLGGIRETVLQDYHSPSEIFIESEEMKGSNFVKRGGNQQPTSAEKEAQDHRESTTLMVFYTSPADVPASPKEPPTPDAEDVVPDEVPFGDVPDHIKARQERYLAYVNPKTAPVTQPQPQLQPQANAAGGGFDISNLLKLIQSGTPPPPPVQQASTQAPVSDLERTINLFRQQQVPQVPQVPQVTAPQPPAPGVDFQGILNVMKQMQQPSPLPQAQQSQPTMAPNLGAIFSQFTGQTQHASGPQLPQQVFAYEDPERKRMRDGDSNDNQYEHSAWSRQKRTKANEPKHYKAGTVACRFWAEGKCRKGENCTFRHDS